MISILLIAKIMFWMWIFAIFVYLFNGNSMQSDYGKRKAETFEEYKEAVGRRFWIRLPFLAVYWWLIWGQA